MVGSNINSVKHYWFHAIGAGNQILIKGKLFYLFFWHSLAHLSSRWRFSISDRIVTHRIVTFEFFLLRFNKNQTFL